MNTLLFILATVINVVLSTIRSICTIKCGKWVSAITNAICYGFYPLIVMLTAKDTVTIVANMVITAVVNFICVWAIKLVEEKARKDKMWKVEMAIPKDEEILVANMLDRKNISHNCVEAGKWVMFNCYCETQEETAVCVSVAKNLKGKISAYESQNLI